MSLGLPFIWVLTCCAGPAWGQSSNTAERLAARIGAINRDAQAAVPLFRASQRLDGLLEERASLLAELIGKDPAKALELTLPSSLIEGLQVGRPNPGLESRGRWDGAIETVISDDFKAKRSWTRWYLNTGLERVEMFFSGEKPSRTGINVSVEGVRLGNRMAISGVTKARPRVTQSSTATAGAPLSCTTTGPQNIAVLMLTTPSNATFPPAYTKASLQEAFFGSPTDTSTTQSLNGYWKEMSYGLTSTVGQVFGPFTLSQDYNYDTQGDLLTAAINAADSTADFTQFTRLALIFPLASYGDWGGWAADDSLGCWTITSPSKGSLPASIGWLPAFPNSSPPIDLYAHELGHALGLHHSSSDEFGTVPIGAIDEKGTLSEYGDIFATMGSNEGQYAAEHKSLLLHWLNAGDYLETISGGNYTLRPLESTANPRGLRVLRDSMSSAWFWLEYRQPIGDVDSVLQDYYGNAPFDGTLVRYEDPYLDSPGHTYLLDFNPISAPNDFTQSALRPGSSWSDPYSLLTLSIGSPVNGGLPVSVTYDQPCASLQYSATTFPASGGSGSIAVSAPGNCQWNASSASSWISFPSSTSGAGDGTVQFSVGANSGPQQQGYIAVQRQSTRIIQKSTSSSVLSVSPSLGTGATGLFTFAFDDVNGYQDVSYVTFRLSGPPDCEIGVYPGSGELYLYGDPGGSSPPPIYIDNPGGTVSNSVCSISSSGSSITGSGSQLLVALQVGFSTSFGGAHRVEAEIGGSGRIPVGTWIVPSAQEPRTTIQASTMGAPFMLDGGAVYAAPATFSWSAGSQHTITWLSSARGHTTSRYVFQNWTDGGSNPRTITVPSAPTTYTANIKVQYQLSLVVTPTGAGQLTATPTSSDGFYDAGASVQIQAAPVPGYSFWYFSGDASGSTNPVTVTTTKPLSVTGNFYCQINSGSWPPYNTSSDSTTGIMEFSTGTGCAWTATSDSPWLTINPPSGTGGSALLYAIAANSGAARTGTVTLTYNGGWLSTYTVNQDAAGSQRATVKSLSPVSGIGLSTAATARFAAPGGYGQISYAIIRYYGTDSNSYCLAEFGQGPGWNAIWLGDDLTSSWLFSSLPGSGTLSVSRCSLDVSTLSFSGNDNNLTLALPFQFAPSFAGKKRVSLQAVTSGTDGWSSDQQMGTWVVGTPSAALRFIPITPCRVVDTRKPDGPFGGPAIAAGTSRDFAIPNSTCNIPATAQAYSLNVTVVPPKPLGYLTIWPTGQARPVASTLNSLDGRIKANASIVPAGNSGAVSVFVSDTTQVLLDIDGYFVPATDASALAFYPLDAVPGGGHPESSRLVGRTGARGRDEPDLADTVEFLRRAGQRAGLFVEPHGGAGWSAGVYHDLADWPAQTYGIDVERADRRHHGQRGDCAGGQRRVDRRLCERRHESGGGHQRLLRSRRRGRAVAVQSAAVPGAGLAQAGGVAGAERRDGRGCGGQRLRGAAGGPGLRAERDGGAAGEPGVPDVVAAGGHAASGVDAERAGREDHFEHGDRADNERLDERLPLRPSPRCPGYLGVLRAVS